MKVRATVVAVVAALGLLSGCSMTERAGAAAIVNGQVIRTQDVGLVTHQLQKIQALATETDDTTVMWLVVGPFILDRASSSGWTPDQDLAKYQALIGRPAEGTTEFIKAQLAASTLQTQDDWDAVVTKLAAADVVLDPRYGTLPTNAADLFAALRQGALGHAAQPWIKATSVPTASTAPTTSSATSPGQ
jgi:hypothetical protein